jgi:hypothetical protein
MPGAERTPCRRTLSAGKRRAAQQPPDGVNGTILQRGKCSELHTFATLQFFPTLGDVVCNHLLVHNTLKPSPTTEKRQHHSNGTSKNLSL